MRPPVDTVAVAWMAHPFAPAVHRAVMPAGGSLAEIGLELATRPPEGTATLPSCFAATGEILIGGHAISREFWLVVRPKAGTHVTFIVLPGKGGGFLSALTAAAGLFFATAISGGAAAGLFGAGTLAAGSFGAHAAGAGVALAFSLAASALAPPPTKPGNGTERAFQSSSIAGNVQEPNGFLQRVIGTRKVYPRIVSPPLSEVVGSRLVTTAVFGLAGPHLLDDIRLGGTKYQQIEDVEVEIRDARTDTSLLGMFGHVRYGYTEESRDELKRFAISEEDSPSNNKIVLEDQSNPSLSVPKWQGFTTRPDPDQFWIHVAFPQGLYSTRGAVDGSPNLVMGVPFRLRIRQLGTSTWTNLPEVHYLSWTTGEKQIAFRLHWVDTVPALEGPQVYSGMGGAHINVPVGSAPEPEGWVADSYFDDGSGNAYWESGSGATRVRRTSLLADGATFYLLRGTFPSGDGESYEVQIIRGCCYEKGEFHLSSYSDPEQSGNVDLFNYYTDAGIHTAPIGQQGTVDQTYCARAITVRQSHPCPDTSNAYIAVKGRGVAVDQLTVVASGYVKDWNGSGWSTWTTTSNPAPHYRDILAGDLNPKPLDGSLIDGTNLLDWRTHCIANSLKCDAILDGGSVQEARELVAAAGFARPYQSEVWGVVIDRDRSADAPVQVFSSRNARMLGTRIDFTERPHALIAKFRNKDRDYDEDFVTVYDTGYNAGNATLLEEITYDALVEQADVEARATFDLAQSRLRMRRHTVEASAEAVVCRRGDLVALQNDVLHRWAGQARVVSKIMTGGLVSGLVLDDVVPTAPSDDLFFGDNEDEANDPFFPPDENAPFFDGTYAAHESFFDPDPNAPYFDGDTVFGEAPVLHAFIRLDDGQGTTITVPMVADGHSDEIHFLTPIADDPDLVSGCLVVTGLAGQSHRRCIVASMTPADDFTWTIECVDEASELFAED